ncbi:MAG: nitroreductase family deazaflavin-dependent oxidoreductase [Anaerolineae bacterium]
MQNQREHRLSNALFMRIAGGPLRAYSILIHTGRKSGRTYQIPITIFPMGDGFILALLYGDAAHVDWCQNIMAAGGCTIRTRWQTYACDRPEIVGPDQALPAYSPLFRFYYRRVQVKQFLWVHRTPSPL